jgi:GntR family transcriptional regulator
MRPNGTRAVAESAAAEPAVPNGALGFAGLERLRLEPGMAAPLYMQLADRIAAAIASGELREGQALPSERLLSEGLAISRTTVRKALDDLINRGLVVARHGSGNFVAAPRLEQPLARLSSFSEDMQARGRKPGFVWVERGVFAPSPEEAIALGLSSGEEVARFVRVRLADGEPLAVERAAIAARHLPNPAVVDSSLYQALRARGLEPVRALQHLRAAAATPADAAHLGIPPGSPVMATVRHGYLADGRPIELTRSVYRGDRYDFVAEMRRG